MSFEEKIEVNCQQSKYTKTNWLEIGSIKKCGIQVSIEETRLKDLKVEDLSHALSLNFNDCQLGLYYHTDGSVHIVIV